MAPTWAVPGLLIGGSDHVSFQPTTPPQSGRGRLRNKVQIQLCRHLR